MNIANDLAVEKTLPPPDAAALEISGKLTVQINNKISRLGQPIGFDDYMDTCLYAPVIGYYNSTRRKFGEHGDFVTAPEISPLFARCLAEQWLQLLPELGGGIIFELGAGSGALASDMLLWLQQHAALPVEYWIFEISAALKSQQQQRLKQQVPELYPRIRWLETLPTEAFTGLVIANEVVDAQPVKRFLKTTAGFNELRVSYNHNKFTWAPAAATSDLLQALNKLEQDLAVPLPEGYCSELNIQLEHWLGALTKSLKKGVLLVIDYGYNHRDYYHPERYDGTLLCHYRHHVHADPFIYPGLQDITASVNFTALATAADQAGLTVSGYTTQAYFLMACGLDKLVNSLPATDRQSQATIAQQVNMLTITMGERFNVMALTKDFTQPLSGFALADKRINL